MIRGATIQAKLLVTGLTLISLIAVAPIAQAKSFITIGTGAVTGVYYPTGGAICRLVNKGRKVHGIRCAVESTDGSVDNINKLRNGDLDMGIAQSDWQYHAFSGTSKFSEQGPFKELRSVFGVRPDTFTVVARADADVKTLMDLKGKRVNIGSPGSGQRGTMEVLMNALGWSKSAFSKVTELNATEQVSALCENKIDVMVYAVAHPSGSIKEVTTSCDSVLVDVTGPAVDKLLKENVFYRKATIPGGMYRGNPVDTKTFGIGASLIASSNMDSETVYQVVKSVFENFDEFKSLHPAFRNLKKSEMIKDGLATPLHDGAIRYYQEAGLMK
jgi:uncharacterized protein